MTIRISISFSLISISYHRIQFGQIFSVDEKVFNAMHRFNLKKKGG
jgi:hypothetical protein